MFYAYSRMVDHTNGGNGKIWEEGIQINKIITLKGRKKLGQYVIDMDRVIFGIDLL